MGSCLETILVQSFFLLTLSHLFLSAKRGLAFTECFLLLLLLLLLSHFSHVWLCDPIDGSPPGSPVPGILQARTLEWFAISFSNAWKWKVKVKLLSCVRLLVTPWTAAYQAPPSVGFSRQEYWSGVPLLSPVLPRKWLILFIGSWSFPHYLYLSCYFNFDIATKTIF